MDILFDGTCNWTPEMSIQLIVIRFQISEIGILFADVGIWISEMDIQLVENSIWMGI